ncbi:MAG TPA: heme NO-binding domain-containing protein [Candidatus Tumulicola sp.]|nr:heme NO-binding domain-containing protein [Candidatus Tumulicola sp.]
MHGIIFVEFHKFVAEKLGPTAWNDVLRAALPKARHYYRGNHYPDHEFADLLAAAASMAKVDLPDFGQQFGEVIAPDLMRMYAISIDSSWRTLEMIENTEVVIHTIVRRSLHGAAPPRLRVERLGPNEIVLRYDSQRKMCYFAKGIALGVAKHFGESITIAESMCMLKGASHCEITFTSSG